MGEINRKDLERKNLPLYMVCGISFGPFLAAFFLGSVSQGSLLNKLRGSSGRLWK